MEYVRYEALRMTFTVEAIMSENIKQLYHGLTARIEEFNNDVGRESLNYRIKLYVYIKTVWLL